MALLWHFEWAVLLSANLAAWWRQLRLSTKVAAAASLLVVGAMAHIGMVVTGHIRDNVLQQSASAAALYMESFVVRHVQELATSQTLSDDNRLALERLLSPASMHRPIIGFRIWKGDTVVFSNERDVIGQTYHRTASRERAWQGQVAVEFEQPDGDDYEQVRSLELPVLEVYAPVRQAGTGRIIALVETYEIAVELERQLWFNQLWVWLAIGANTLAVSLLLFSIASTGAIERKSLLGQIGRLAHQRAESERRRHRISQANLQVCAMNERSLRSVGNELHHELGQHLALALLKFEALDLLVADANAAMPSRSATHQKDLVEIRKALSDTLRRIRQVASGFPPADIERLSLEETLAGAAKHHENRTGIPVEFRSCGLPEQLSFALKASLYRFTTECLDSTYPAHAQSVSVSCDHKIMTLEILGGQGTLNAENAEDPDVAGNCPAFGNLRDRMEAIGGRLRLAPTPGGEFSIIAEFSFADMEAAGG